MTGRTTGRCKWRRPVDTVTSTAGDRLRQPFGIKSQPIDDPERLRGVTLRFSLSWADGVFR